MNILMFFNIIFGKLDNEGVTPEMDAVQANYLGAFLRRVREARAMSTRSLASAVGGDMGQIVRLEKGAIARPRPEMLTRIAAALDLPPADVLTMAGYPALTELPSFTPYLRARYDLPDAAVAEMEAFFARLAARHGVAGPVDREDEQ